MDLIYRMLEHDRWTTAKYLELCRDLTDAQLDQEFDIGLRTLRATFDHMIFNVGFWAGLMAGQPFKGQRDDLSLDRLLERHERTYDTFATLARRLRDEQRLDEAFVDHFDYPQTQGGTILHVVLHNAQHRSEMLHIFRRLGIPDPPEGDPQEWEHLTGLIGEVQS